MAITCPYCRTAPSSSEARSQIVGFGSFGRKSDQSRQYRFLCKPCQRTFSVATLSPCQNQKKRHLNPPVYSALVRGISQRRLARVLKINRKTVVRKFIFLGLWSYHFFSKHRELQPPCREIEFDDLETLEHSKLKPLSVTMAVESGTRRVLGFRVAQMPDKGLLVQRSLK